jgi:hypothetical protein
MLKMYVTSIILYKYKFVTGFDDLSLYLYYFTYVT